MAEKAAKRMGGPLPLPRVQASLDAFHAAESARESGEEEGGPQRAELGPRRGALVLADMPDHVLDSLRAVEETLSRQLGDGHAVTAGDLRKSLTAARNRAMNRKGASEEDKAAEADRFEPLRAWLYRDTVRSEP
jgi:hypothetical protein